MPKYTYLATARDGSLAKGTTMADTREAAHLALYEAELRDIKVTEKRTVLEFELTGSSVKRDDLMHLSRQLGAFVKAGLPILEAVHTIAEESESKPVRQVMYDIEDGLRSGDPFSVCLDRHPKVFPEYYRGIVRSAELTGELDVVLNRLSKYIERDLEARRKIKSATTYPAVVACLAIVAVGVIGWWVLPKFKTFFDSLDARLPITTRMLLWMTNFLDKWWWAVIGAIVLAALCVLGVLQTDKGRFAKDRLALAIPVMGETIQYALVERFCRILASMVGAGVSLPESLRVATDSLKNRVYIRGLDGVTEMMLEGQGLAGPLAKTELFPPAASQMLRVGEQTGTLDSQLEVTAAYYEEELDYKIAKLTAIFEPAIIIVMGAIVGFVAIALVSAMYGVFRQVKV